MGHGVVQHPSIIVVFALVEILGSALALVIYMREEQVVGTAQFERQHTRIAMERWEAPHTWIIAAFVWVA
jgi:hypothetical protein